MNEKITPKYKIIEEPKPLLKSVTWTLQKQITYKMY